MTQQLHVAGLPRPTEDGYFDTVNANKSWVRVHGVNPPSFPSIPPHSNAPIDGAIDGGFKNAAMSPVQLYIGQCLYLKIKKILNPIVDLSTFSY